VQLGGLALRLRVREWLSSSCSILKNFGIGFSARKLNFKQGAASRAGAYPCGRPPSTLPSKVRQMMSYTYSLL
jgi:hypothetical protein